MKIKLLFLSLIVSVTFLNAQNEDTSSGWEEGVAAIIEMTPIDKDQIPSIYVGNLPQVWIVVDAEIIYTNKKKNVFVLSDSNESTLEIKMRPNLKAFLKKHRKAKAFLVTGTPGFWHVVNESGKVIKKIEK